MLLGHSNDMVYMFKMFTCGLVSKVNLVRRMQPGGDLKNEWAMFDHMKKVKDWPIKGIHVYDLEYCKVMTISIHDMQSKTTKA
jgi:hypothetical protein